MLDPLAFYIPEDRRQAIAGGKILAGRMKGAALYADVSGFTPLTEALVHLYGPQRGAEELTSHLDRVYNALIQQLHRYQGSVIGYSGDAITCWFHEDDGHRAIATALGMHAAMKQLAAIPLRSGETISLAVKVAVVTGEGQRMLVGDPAIQLIDLLGFPVVEPLAVAAEIAHSGEIVVDGQTVIRLKDELIVGDRREAPDAFDPFFIVRDLKTSVTPTPWPELDPDSLKEEQLRPWVLPAIYERMRQGYSQFMTELRPTVALFLQFKGIDFDHDPQAEARLNSYVCWVQSVMARYEGVLLQVILGEKGNYLYGTFGAPVVHEDDARRAVSAALELLTPPPTLSFIHPVPIGLSRGTMRTGPVGSMLRHTYSVMGDEVNVAARLMEAAAPGELLVTDRVIQPVQGLFKTQRLPALKVKGKTMPVPVYRILGAAEGVQPARSDTGAVLVGRIKERTQLDEMTGALMLGQSHVLIIEGEAGIGKSQLIANWLEQSESSEVKTLIGAGDAIEQSTPYHSWRSILGQLLHWDALPQDRETRRGVVIERLQSLGLESRAPLLNVVLPLDFPDNDLTMEMTGKVRADNTSEVIITLLGQAASTQPLRIIIEDVHWMDSASWAFTQAVIRQVRPLLMVLVTRPVANDGSPEYQALLESPNVLRLQLQALDASDTIGLVCKRLGVDTLPEPVTTLILEKAEGHPFFSEELAYALRDSGVLQIADRRANITAGVDLKTLNLPDTVEGVVTSRIDLLTPGQQLTVKVASVIGRIFAYRVLEQVHPVSSDRPRLPDYLERLQNLDVTPQATPPPDLSYMFKHIITQEVAYNLLLFEQRRQLHRAVAEWYEGSFERDLSPYYPLLAHHWLNASQSSPSDAATVKALDYLEKAGEAALRNYANREAVDYFTRLEAMVTPERSASFGISPLRIARWEYQLGESYNRLGLMVECEQHFARSLIHLKWPLPDARLREMTAVAGQIAKQIRFRLRRAGKPAHNPLGSDELEATRLACKIYERLGLLYFLKNNPGLSAYYCVLASLNLAEEIGPSPELAIAYSYVAGGAGLVPAHGLARLYERLSLETAEQVNNPLITARVLMATSVYSAGVGRFEETEKRLRRAVTAFEQGGVWEWWGVCMEMLTRVTYYRGRFQQSAVLASQLYSLAKQQGDILQQSWSLSSQMEAHLLLEDHDDILGLAREMEELAIETHETGSLQKSLGVSAQVHLKRGDYAAAYESVCRLLDIISSETPTSFGLLTVYTAAADVCLALWEQGALPDMNHLSEQTALACELLTRYAKILPIGAPARLRMEGRHIWLSGHQNRALAMWHQGLKRARELQMPLEESLLHYELGRHASGDDAIRHKHLEQAGQLLRELGVGYFESRLQEAWQGNS